MKKTILLFISIIAVNFSYSQISFGVKSGVNIATTKNLIAFPENRLGWYNGVYSRITITRKTFIQPEILYSSKGRRTQNNFNNSKTALRLNYLSIPLMLGYEIDNKTSLLLGPEFGYLTSAHLLFSNKENLNVSNNYPPKYDVGLGVGLNYHLFKRTGFEVRYIYGFNTLYSVDAAGTRYTDIKGGNRVFQIGFNYLIGN